MSRQFTVTAERGRTGWWVTEYAEVGAVSQIHRLDQVCDDTREVVAYLTGLSEDDVAIDIVPALPQAYREYAARVKEEREKGARARERATAESRMVARALREAGLALRDVGTVMGISHQRAPQLLARP